MSDGLRLEQAARLLTLVAIGRARHPSISPTLKDLPMDLMKDPQPTAEVAALAGDVLRKIALDASGQQLDAENPADWDAIDAIDAAEPEFVIAGTAHFKIVSENGGDLARAIGVLAEGDQALAFIVEFAPDEPVPPMDSYIALTDEETGVPLVFYVALTRADLDAAPDLGPGAVREDCGLQPGQGLLVLALEEDGDHA